MGRASPTEGFRIAAGAAVPLIRLAKGDYRMKAFAHEWLSDLVLAGAFVASVLFLAFV